MTEHFYAVVMAGGGGTRLWPVSRRARPKQMLKFGADRTLFQLAVDRWMGIIPIEHVLVVTVADQAQALREQYPAIPVENFLVEPLPRGTASVVGLAAMALQQRDREALMGVVAADHIIANVPGFHSVIKAGFAAAEQDLLVTLGIHPTFASTGFGYIQIGAPLGFFEGKAVFKAAKFKEKPQLEQAEHFLADGNHAWNSGMFFWKAERILAEISRIMPDLSAQLDTIGQAWDSAERQSVLQAVWPAIHPETIDFGVMEKAQDVVVIPVHEIGWNDVGSWDTLFDVLPAGEAGNIVVGADHIGVETRDTLIYSETQRLIATIGIEDLVVIDTGDALLVSRRDQVQNVRQVVDQLKKKNFNHYL